MEEYITELANDIAKSCPDLVENGCGNDNCVACLAFKLMGLGYKKQTPTADVVPKGEVDEIVRQWKEEANCWQNNYITELRANEQIRAEVSREIFEEIEELAKIYTFPVVKNGVVEIAKEPFWCIEPNDLAELKNKYTEETE